LFYLFSIRIETFYAANLVLGALGVLCFGAALNRFGLSKGTVAATLLLYVSHFYVYWIVSLPMAENLSLLLMNVLLLYLTSNAAKRTKVIKVVGALFFFAMTKFAHVFSSVGVAIFVVSNSYAGVLKKHAVWSVLVMLLVVCAAMQLIQIFYPGLLRLFINQLLGNSDGIKYFSLQFFPERFSAYLLTFLGMPRNFLWMTTPLTSGITALLMVAGVVSAWKSARPIWRTVAAAGLCMMCGQLMMLFLFYHSDTRYILHFIPFMVVYVGFALQSIAKHQRVLVGMLTVLCIAQVWSQMSGWRYLVATNWLHRSVAWQREAVRVLDASVPDNGVVITALPPFFVQAYQQKGYRVLPLSQHQEFLQKNQQVWGSDVMYLDLFQTYDKLIQQSVPVYVSTSYLTADKRFEQDYLRLLDRYDMEIVTDGCLHTCAVYRLQIKVNKE
jgi:hypothetical protein